jgi:hypothetical protein
LSDASRFVRHSAAAGFLLLSCPAKKDLQDTAPHRQYLFFQNFPNACRMFFSAFAELQDNTGQI